MYNFIRFLVLIPATLATAVVFFFPPLLSLLGFLIVYCLSQMLMFAVACFYEMTIREAPGRAPEAPLPITAVLPVLPLYSSQNRRRTDIEGDLERTWVLE